ncbi:hypothetical protein BBD46_06840 [Natrialba sp. SSL1]|nr:hypothetical protein BBD46_06840 [Natrialba sp. SSL1]
MIFSICVYYSKEFIIEVLSSSILVNIPATIVCISHLEVVMAFRPNNLDDSLAKIDVICAWCATHTNTNTFKSSIICIINIPNGSSDIDAFRDEVGTFFTGSFSL